MAESSSPSTTAATSAGSRGSSNNTAPASWIAAGMSHSTALRIQAAKRRGDWVEAVELLTPLLDSASSSQLPPFVDSAFSLIPVAAGLANLRYQRAECAFRLSEYHAALRDCDRVLAVEPTSVSAASLRVKCLLGLRRYSEAEAEIAELNQRDKRGGTAHFDSLNQMWKCNQLERQGQYDMAAIKEESVSLLTPSGTCNVQKLRQMGTYPCVRLGPHADYLHPEVECAVEIAGKGRGIRVRASSSTAAPADSSSLPSPSLGSLSKHTLVMNMTAVAMCLRSDGVGKEHMLMRKLADQPHLVEQVKRLFGLASQESNRTQLFSEASAEEVWKRPAATPSAATTASTLGSKESLVATLRHNPFADPLSDEWRDLCVGGGLFFLPSFFNHSCVPNCNWQPIGDQMFVHTIREVAPGEELTITYSPPLTDNLSKRQAKLDSSWHFVCQCERCALEQPHPELQAREEQLEAECAQLETAFKQLQQTRPQATDRIAELEKIASRMQSLVGEHERFASTLSSPSSSLIQSESPVLLQLLPQLRRLSDVLESILALLPPGDTLLPLLFEKHRRVCVTRTLIMTRWGGCARPAYRASIFRMLAMQQLHPKHATYTTQQQEQHMAAWIRECMASQGDTNAKQLGVEHGEEIDRGGLEREHREEIDRGALRPLFDKCCAAIAKEKSSSNS